MSVEQIPLFVESYDDSLFTNAHDLVSMEKEHDGRGTFTHLGVRMEGLESRRHLNFCFDGESLFWRDPAVRNNVVLRLVSGEGNTGTVLPRCRIHRVGLSTRFFTRNHTKWIHEICAIDETTGACVQLVNNMVLEGDSYVEIDVKQQPTATKIRLSLSEGGLARFKLFGERLDDVSTGLTDLLLGGNVFDASDASYGDPALSLRSRREGKIMAGWESCRHSSRHLLGLKLGQVGVVKLIEVDTYMHCLNAFQALIILGCKLEPNSASRCETRPGWLVHFNGTCGKVDDSDLNNFLETRCGAKYELDMNSLGSWRVLLPPTKLQRDTLHRFEVHDEEQVSHLLVFGIPDGGIHRIGVYGTK